VIETKNNTHTTLYITIDSLLPIPLSFPMPRPRSGGRGRAAPVPPRDRAGGGLRGAWAGGDYGATRGANDDDGTSDSEDGTSSSGEGEEGGFDAGEEVRWRGGDRVGLDMPGRPPPLAPPPTPPPSFPS
jgi:hypothetical protein